MKSVRNLNLPRLFVAGICAAALCASLAACGSSTAGSTKSTATSSSGSKPAAKTNVSIGYASPIAVQPGQQLIADGLQNGAKSEGWTSAVLDANLSPDKQLANVQTFLTQGKNALAAWSLDPGAVGGAYTQANAKGIPVIGVNSVGAGINTNIIWELFHCAPNDVHTALAQYVAERIPHAKVLMIGPPPVPSLVDGDNCFKRAAKAAGLTVLTQKDNPNSDAANATPIASALLTKYPEAQVIWNFNDSTALGASAAVIAAHKPIWSGKKKGIMIIGGNADPDAIEAIKQGRLSLTVDDQPAATGWAIVKVLAMHFADGVPLAKLPKEIVLENPIVDLTNMDQFVDPGQRKYTLDNLPIKSTTP